MSDAQGVGDQSDLTRVPKEKDGSFNRQVSSFRDTIEKGGKFEPEKGLSFFISFPRRYSVSFLQDVITSTLPLDVVSLDSTTSEI